MKIILKDFTKIPNLISTFRMLLLIPVFILLSDLQGNRQILIVIILIAYISDLSDGYIARKTNQITELGKLLDPLGDKIFVIVITSKLYMEGEIDSLYFWVIILRDILIFTGGVIISRIIGKIIPSNLLGKITVFSIGTYILSILFGLEQSTIYSKILYYTSFTLAIGSLIGYAIRAYETVKWYSKHESS